MASENDAGEDLSLRCRRLRYRAWHRGTRELDLLLGPYAEARAWGMERSELDGLERLLGEEDTDLQAWFLGREPAPDYHLTLIADVLSHRMASLTP